MEDPKKSGGGGVGVVSVRAGSLREWERLNTKNTDNTNSVLQKQWPFSGYFNDLCSNTKSSKSKI
ncbi:hypothetical protein TYRP_009663 [Tyrophagus putrescentiae]|nr:hypothetical protein TYRP_009663 [Tyrophagus putrescentiae]